MWIRLLKVGGVTLYVDLVVVALLAWLGLSGEAGEAGERLGLAAVALGSVLLHEAGHAAAARAQGLRVAGIYLHVVPFAYVERGRPGQEIVVALCGPAVNLGLGAALLAVCAARGAPFPWLEPGAWLAEPLWMGTGVNLLMGVLNLVPALPADGGRALRAFLLQRASPAAAHAWTARVGACVGLGVLGLSLWLARWPDSAALAVAGAFLMWAAWREGRAA